MSRGYSTTHHTPRRHSSVTPYVLVVGGLVLFCLAVLAPVSDISAGLTLSSLTTSGTVPALDGRILVVSGGLLLVSAVSTLFGLVLLFIRLT
ncbi:hypothetical protein GJR96_07680 [Haloferax sp. MBLA0076]|uniref:Uncharacterized protein n=1 Tax=Haloferax litoreum TaxID=2666140 RepID=A0A6A8GFD0_9EURY|nr:MULTISPECIES: hypothetical protein [Haloferax]KAB1193329.1 hypothetical protein Hfx1148_07670 [Haloferax sp. CBA1148]MRX21835.1 hypothetical protein [Haloferax litoreum]